MDDELRDARSLRQKASNSDIYWAQPHSQAFYLVKGFHK